MRERVLISAHAATQQNLLEEQNRKSKNWKEETIKEMYGNIQMCRRWGMAAEKKRNRNTGDSNMLGSRKKEGNHKPIEDKMIDQGLEFIHGSN
jgi:hypothetical protein